MVDSSFSSQFSGVEMLFFRPSKPDTLGSRPNRPQDGSSYRRCSSESKAPRVWRASLETQQVYPSLKFNMEPEKKSLEEDLWLLMEKKGVPWKIPVDSCWWFQIFFIFIPNLGEDDPIWLLFFKWVGSTTNQFDIGTWKEVSGRGDSELGNHHFSGSMLNFGGVCVGLFSLDSSTEMIPPCHWKITMF